MENIAIILLDQIRTDMLGCYGHNVVKTPNMDNLADEGVIFDRAYTPASVCCPARTSLFTGQMPTNHKIIRNVEKAEVQDPSLNNPNIISDLKDHNKYRRNRETGSLRHDRKRTGSNSSTGSINWNPEDSQSMGKFAPGSHE